MKCQLEADKKKAIEIIGKIEADKQEIEMREQLAQD